MNMFVYQNTPSTVAGLTSPPPPPVAGRDPPPPQVVGCGQPPWARAAGSHRPSGGGHAPPPPPPPPVLSKGILGRGPPPPPPPPQPSVAGSGRSGLATSKAPPFGLGTASRHSATQPPLSRGHTAPSTPLARGWTKMDSQRLLGASVRLLDHRHAWVRARRTCRRRGC
jgi:hypothetical protein